MRVARCLLGLLPIASASLPAQHGALFEPVAQTLAERFHDPEFRAQRLPELTARFRVLAVEAPTLELERAVVHGYLAAVPASHLALYSRATYDELMADLAGRNYPTLGLALQQQAGRFWIARLLEGGPAERAGLLRGDRVLAVDGVPVGRSPRLDARSDDAALPDPPLHRLDVALDEVVRLRIERRPGQQFDVDVTAARHGAWQATLASVRVLRDGAARIGYVHLHCMYLRGIGELLRELAAEVFADCDAVILDLRGRGGSAAAVEEVLACLRGRGRVFHQPVVALIDAQTRSAKEVLAHELQRQGLATLVGERTAGAVLPATFVPVGDEHVLMFPATRLGAYSRQLEGIGVTPDLRVAAAGMYAAGADPILRAGLRALAEH